MWYATQPNYFCSAIAAMRLLKKLRGAEDGTANTITVDYVLVYSKEDLLTERSKKFAQKFKDEGGILREFPSADKKGLRDAMYGGSVGRFNAFKLTEYDRLIMTDADGMPMKNMDHLFQLKQVHISSSD